MMGKKPELYGAFLKHGALTTRAVNEKIAIAENLDSLIKENGNELLNEKNEVGDYIAQLLYKYDKKSTVVSECIGLNRSYIGLIINGNKNNPSRDILICICIEIGATVEELQCLLKFSGYAQLYSRKKRDLIIEFCIKNKKTLFETNEYVISHGCKPLFKKP